MRIDVTDDPYFRKVRHLADEKLVCRVCGLTSPDQLYFCDVAKLLFCNKHAGSLFGCHQFSAMPKEHFDFKVDAFEEVGV